MKIIDETETVVPGLEWWEVAPGVEIQLIIDQAVRVCVRRTAVHTEVDKSPDSSQPTPTATGPRYRTGRHNDQLVYRLWRDQPDDRDVLVATCFSPVTAAFIVEAMNARAGFGAPVECVDHTFGEWYLVPRCLQPLSWLERGMPARPEHAFGEWHPIMHLPINDRVCVACGRTEVRRAAPST